MQDLLPMKIFRVRDHSMEPSLNDGDYVLANLWFLYLSKGDIVVLRHPKKDMVLVKRIEWADRKKAFVVGDNKGESEDSRSFGPVSVTSVIGKVMHKV